MTAASTAAPRGSVVWWKDLERWVIPPNVFLRRSLPAGWTRVRVGILVRQVTARVKTESDLEYKMAGVKWYGEGVFHRETVRGDGMSAGQVTPLIPGALIYNRLYAWKASFAVVPPEYADYYVSNEFPQFILDEAQILPEYLYLFCTREATIRAVNAASTGSAAVSRNRFKEDQFLSFEILLPPLTEQKAIVARWRDARDEIASAHQRAELRTATINSRFFSDLGLRSPDALVMPKAFAVLWKDFLRWGVEFNFLNQSGADLSRGKYPVVTLGSILDMVQCGTSEKANTLNDGSAVIRMNNIVKWRVRLDQLETHSFAEVRSSKAVIEGRRHTV
jgi:type I restriction enzyme, S subunit